MNMFFFKFLQWQIPVIFLYNLSQQKVKVSQQQQQQ